MQTVKNNPNVCPHCGKLKVFCNNDGLCQFLTAMETVFEPLGTKLTVETIDITNTPLPEYGCAICGAPCDTANGDFYFCQEHQEAAIDESDPICSCGGKLTSKDGEYFTCDRCMLIYDAEMTGAIGIAGTDGGRDPIGVKGDEMGMVGVSDAGLIGTTTPPKSSHSCPDCGSPLWAVLNTQNLSEMMLLCLPCGKFWGK